MMRDARKYPTFADDVYQKNWGESRVYMGSVDDTAATESNQRKQWQ